MSFYGVRRHILGHRISEKGIQVDKSEIEIIASLPYPSFVRAIHYFLGHAGFYRRFIRNFSTIALPLSKLFAEECDI